MIAPPTRDERRIVARCLLESGILIGSQDEIWTHPKALMALGTLRMCVDAIVLLIGGGHGVRASFVKTCVMQTDGLSAPPFALDEMAEFLLDDSDARSYWEGRVPDDRFPKTCDRCGSAAYWGLNFIECKVRCSPGR